MRQYQQSLYDEAKRQGLTAAQLRTKGYHQLAELCGINTSVKNYDFFHVSVKHFVVAKLEREEFAALMEERRSLFESTIKALPGYTGAKVVVTDKNELMIDLGEPDG